MPRRTPWLDLEPMPNKGSRHQTPASVYIDAHYHTLELTRRWSWFRYTRLCNRINMTPYELGSLVMLSHASIAAFEKKKVMDKRIARPVALLLTLFEAHLFGEMLHDVIKNPFPDLAAVISARSGLSTPPPAPEPPI